MITMMRVAYPALAEPGTATTTPRRADEATPLVNTAIAKAPIARATFDVRRTRAAFITVTSSLRRHDLERAAHEGVDPAEE